MNFFKKPTSTPTPTPQSQSQPTIVQQQQKQQHQTNHGLSKQIVTSIPTLDDFKQMLLYNPGLIILKLGAEWCGPCKRIKQLVHGFFATTDERVLCADIDVDESMELYSFLKKKRMVNGIPVLLLYKKGNQSFVPNDSITGADPNGLNGFFQRHHLHLKDVIESEQRQQRLWEEEQKKQQLDIDLL